MKDRILHDPSFGLGLVVWLAAATLFPWHLGVERASFFHLAGYLAIAGTLLAVADALLNSAFYHRVGDVALQALFWVIGLSVPAAVLFALGSSAGAANEQFQDQLCAMAGLDNPADASETPLEEALEPGEDCEVQR